jgi:DNA processing protein
VRFGLLEKRFGSLAEAWKAGESDLRSAGLDSGTARSIVESRGKLDPEAELPILHENGVTAITSNDSEYPARLKEVYDAPPVLFLKGHIAPEDERSIAVVGTRRVTAYGREVTHRLATDLAATGVTIVSGMASGVDGVAHRAALDTGMRTLAVLGSGVDVIYPRQHQRLAAEIVDRGALISEHPLGTRPKAEHFPRRNRILSGLALGTLVTEAAEASGALITARHALEQNREVFAVPGSMLAPNSKGTNGLIQRGEAKLVMDHADILEELNLSYVGKQIEMQALFPANDVESKVLYHLSREPTHIDQIIRESGMGITDVSSMLAMMELQGVVRQVGGMNYVRA